jgi:hypothetical protein
VPVPRASSFPKHQRWTIVQRAISWAETRALAKKLIALDGQILEGHHRELVGGHAEAEAKRAWLQIWVTIVQTLGLAYTADEGTTIHVTNTGRFVARYDEPLAFYLSWGLGFQFPHGYPKHKHYVEHGVCVQPLVLLLEYLLALQKFGKPATPTFLIYDEVIVFCMRRTDHAADQTIKDVAQILENRKAGYDYSRESRAVGYSAVRQNFANRSKLYFEPTQLISYQRDRVLISPGKLKVAEILLKFRIPPTPFITNTEGARNRYITTAFNRSESDIKAVYLACSTLRLPEELPPPVEVPSADQALEAEADEWIQSQTKSKAALLKEARSYSPPKESHKRRYARVKRRVEDARQKARIKELEDGSCQICDFRLEYKNKAGKTRYYIEFAHIKAKRKHGDDSLFNSIILCPNCHVRLDRGFYEISFEKKAILQGGKPILLHHDHHLFV